MTFKAVIGQQSTITTLRNLVDNDRLPHATLVHGPQGCGKLSLVLAAVQYLFCDDRKEGDSCGVCQSCSKVSKLIHPDIHFTFPFITTKESKVSDQYLSDWRNALLTNPYMDVNDWLELIGAANKQGNITKDECLNIIKKLSLKAFQNKFKICIIWLPEYLGKEGNRLLKLIEEPPADTFFFLITENTQQILNTILSRCQVVKASPLSEEEIKNALIENKELASDKAEVLSFIANGDYNQALALADNIENDNAALFLEWMRKVYKGNGVHMVSWVDKIAGIGRENQKYFIQYALHFLRELMVIKMTGTDKVRLSKDDYQTALKLTKIIEFNHIEAITKLLNEVGYAILRNANPKILFLDASIQMNQILKNKQKLAAV